MPTDLITKLILRNSEFDRNLRQSKKELAAFKDTVSFASNSVKAFVGGFAGMAGVSFAFMDMTQRTMEFEKSLSGLKSLTGLGAEEMEYLKNAAIKLGSTSTQTASQVVEAYKLIGSQQPELLKNKEALNEVTKQAIVLAEAAGMDVPSAAKALSGSINQMGESASVAGEYVNILAAASQTGSADIGYLSKAIEKSGGAASSVGIRYNELVAAIEAIAPKITEASEAGTNLRNIFLILESSSDKNLKPSVVGLSKALDNLAAKNLDATQMTKLFGRESVTAALALVNAKDQYNDYVRAITGTNTAIEQQRINNDNLAGSIKALSSEWEGFILTLNKSNGQLKKTTDFITATLHVINEAIKSESDKRVDYMEKSWEKERESLDKLVKSYRDYGLSAGEAIKKSKEDIIKWSDGGESFYDVYSVELAKLQAMQKRKNELTEKGRQVNRRSYQEGLELDSLREQVKIQERIVFEANVKNQIYKKGLDYLDDEYARVLAIADKTKEATSNMQTGVTEEMRKAWRSEDTKLRRETSFSEFTEDVGIKLRKELRDRADKAPIPVSYMILPTFEESEETPDITGSVADFEKRLQDVTLAYNEATNADLRSLYAKRIEDLQETLEKMTDVNEGMVDIAAQINDMIQESVVSGFEGLGEAIATGDPLEALRGMLSSMMDMLKQFGSALVATGLAAEALKKVLVNPFAAIAAGGALIVAATAAKAALQKAATPMANGGIVYGETFARVGEYPGASYNPEVVAPLDKLRKLIEPRGDEGETVHVTGRLVGEGSSLIAVIDSTGRKMRRTR